MIRLLVATSFLVGSTFVQAETFLGVGYAISVKTENSLSVGTQPSIPCRVQTDGSLVEVLGEIDPGYSDTPVSMDLSKAAGGGTAEGSSKFYSAPVAPQAESRYCGGSITGGKQSLIISGEEPKAEYILKTETQCLSNGKAFTNISIQRCNLGLSLARKQ